MCDNNNINLGKEVLTALKKRQRRRKETRDEKYVTITIPIWERRF